MPSLTKHQSNSFVKLLLLGDAKSGKTGSLVSLVESGFKLRILDMDNLLDILKFQIMERCPDKIDNVEFRSLRDKRKQGPMGTMIDGKPTAWIESLKMLNRWKYDDIDLGDPAEWGPDCILVIDSLSRWCDSALAFHEAVTKNADGRAIYYSAQKDMEAQLASLTSDNIKTNVIVICHGTYIDLDNGQKKIFPQGVGSALSPKIPQYFPTYIRYINRGGKRTIQMESDAMIDLANPRPSAMQKTYPIETGLADIFKILLEQKEAPGIQRNVPKPVTLKRA